MKKNRSRDSDEEPRKKRRVVNDEDADDEGEGEDEEEEDPKKRKKKVKAPSTKTDFREEWNDDDDDEDGEDKDDTKDKLTDGKNIRRILPNKEEGEPFFVDWAMHYNMGPDGEESFRCIEPGGPFGLNKKKDKQRGYKAKLCPSCKKFCREKSASRKFEFGSKAGKKYWADRVVPWRAKYQFAMGMTRPKSDDPSKVRVYQCGVMVAKPLIQAFYDSDQGGDFTDPESGRNVLIKKTKLGGGAMNIEYDVKILPDRTPCRNWKRVRKNLPDLASFVPEALDADAIMAIITGEGDDSDALDKARVSKRKKRRGDDDDDDSDDDDNDDDEDNEPRPRKRSRRRDDEDIDPDEEEDVEDADDDDEEDEEDDDDDDDEKPAKKRLKKKARRDRDD